MTKTWMITGVSDGLGREIARAALKRGDVVVGTVRRPEAVAAFEALAPGRAHGVVMDVTDTAAVAAAVAKAEGATGTIDVLVNNAGYGLVGAVEEASLDEVRAQFEVNVFGPLAVLKAALPAMRARRAGRIINITSVSGLAVWAGTGVYCASKWALEGLTQTLAQEVAELGIRVVNVAPGGLRTDFATGSKVIAADKLSDYDGLARDAERIMADHAGQEPGDPAKAARAILTIADIEAPPMHLLLGEDALKYAGHAAQGLAADIEAWKALSLSIGFND
ncbi:oxidoreductase [Caulobacter segnis]|uniref:oxidoreductase n=1 Tax=Caulobacter segnis TaxID=88688 RepID=UPI002858CC7C|nr:oxidoreductase [Caulobacter segnis]MDR6625617.1 NAD(P)-dependent dehydrogenase (short-subunit alcohol dehydrogenase family) [Caulobacter segnis]